METGRDHDRQGARQRRHGHGRLAMGRETGNSTTLLPLAWECSSLRLGLGDSNFRTTLTQALTAKYMLVSLVKLPSSSKSTLHPPACHHKPSVSAIARAGFRLMTIQPGSALGPFLLSISPNILFLDTIE